MPFLRAAARLSVTPLPGGVTNRTFKVVDAGGETVVIRLMAEGAEVLGIDRRRERRCLAAAGRLGVAPELLFARPAEGILVTRHVEGRPLDPGRAAGPAVRRRLVRAMRRYHAGPAFPGTFSPSRTLRAYRATAGAAAEALASDLDDLHAQVGRLARILGRTRGAMRPCHNDLWGPNLLDDGRRLWIVDWEYAAMGDVYFDLANFAVYHCPSMGAQRALLRAYFGRERARDLARLKVMSAVVLLREAMWYVVARRLPTGRREFDRAAEAFFTRCRAALADPRLPGWVDRLVRGP